METFRGFGKRSLIRIAESRNIDASGTADQIRSRLIERDTPFSIDPSQTQEEIVLSLINIPTFKLREYVFQDGHELNLSETKGDRVEERVSLLENILNENLTDLSVDIVRLGLSPTHLLQRQAGRAGNRAELIRTIVGLKHSEGSLIDKLRDDLENVGFKIIKAPPKRTPSLLDEEPHAYDANEVREYLDAGVDSAYFPDYLLEEVVQDDLLFPRDVNVRSFARRLVTDPISEIWPNVKPLLEGRTRETLQQLAENYGYDVDLTINELEFLFQRQYLRKYEPKQYDIPERFKELLMDQMNFESFEEVEMNLNEDEMLKLELYSEWVDYNDEQLQNVAQGYDIELPYPKTREFFEADLLSYLEIGEDQLEPGADSLELYSDSELLRWCPRLPYGRNEMVEEFKRFWGSPRFIFVNDAFYRTTSWDEVEEVDDVLFEELSLDELKTILPYLKGTQFQEEVLEIYAIKLSENAKLEASDEIRELLKLVAIVAAATYGATNEKTWSNTRRPPNTDLLERYRVLLSEALEKINDPVLEEWKLYSLDKNATGKSNIKQMLNKQPNWYWIETAFYYYARITAEPLSNNIPFLFRKN